MPSSTRLSSQNDNASTSAQKGWSTGLEARAQATLPDFLLRQRWYPAKDGGRPIAAALDTSVAMTGGTSAHRQLKQPVPAYQVAAMPARRAPNLRKSSDVPAQVNPYS